MNQKDSLLFAVTRSVLEIIVRSSFPCPVANPVRTTTPTQPFCGAKSKYTAYVEANRRHCVELLRCLRRSSAVHPSCDRGILRGQSLLVKT